MDLVGPIQAVVDPATPNIVRYRPFYSSLTPQQPRRLRFAQDGR